MFRQIGMGAAAVLTAGVLAIGCSDDSGGDTITGGSLAFPGAFPGSAVNENFVGSDGLAFTNPNHRTLSDTGGGSQENQTGQPRMWWNRANSTAIMLYTAMDREDVDTAERMMMATYFDGTRFHSPVQIRGNGNGAVEDPGQRPQGYKVLWLATAGNADPDVAATNGDAIILFNRLDLDLTQSVAGSNEDANIRVWLAYFDVSQVGAPAGGGFVRGFTNNAVALDTDIIATGGDTDIETFGFVSDGLVGSQEFTGETDAVDSGDFTSYVYVIYGKDTNAAATPSPRFRFVGIDLATIATVAPTPAGTDLAIGASAFDASEGADIFNSIVVHNNLLLWQSNGVGTASGEDTIVTATLFQETTPGAVGTVTTLNEALTTQNDNAFLPSASNVYGEDSGVDLFYIFYLGSGYTTTAPATGDRAGDQDAMLTTISLGSTATTVERAEIDAFQNGIDLTLGGDGAVVLRDGTNGDVNGIATRIARSSRYILVGMTGDNTDISDADQATANTVNITQVLFLRAVQTRIPATVASTRTLANALAPILTAPSLGTAVTSAPADAEAGVTNAEFQQDLAHGQGTAQARDIYREGGNQDTPVRGLDAGANRGCALQGNDLRMNFIYQQLGDQAAAATLDEVRLLVNGVTVGLGANDTTAPTATLVNGSEVVVETVDSGYTGNSFIEAVAFDAGDAGVTGSPPVATATAGRVIVFFVSNDNNKLDNTVAGSFVEQRLYAWENGTVTTVSTNPATATLDHFQVGATSSSDLGGLLGGISVPVNENTSQFSAVATTLHVYWQELQSAVGNNGRFAANIGTRSYNLTQTAGTTAVALADRFTPPTGDDPVLIDNPAGGQLFGDEYGGDDLVDSQFHMVRGGSTVGVYFDQDNRLWYQQTSNDGEGYYNNNGEYRPELVDHNSEINMQRRFHIGETLSPPVCNNLSRSVVYWERFTQPFQQYFRGFVRVAR